MSVRSLVHQLTRHPLARRGGRFAAWRRFARWQLAQRLMPVPMAVPFVGSSVLLLTKGLAGATGNWYYGLHEWREMGFALHLLRPGDLFADVGANVGSYTVLAAAGIGARCISVEPAPASAAALARNVAVNGIDGLVTLHRVGVSDAPGTLHFSDGLDAVNHVLAEDESGPSITIEVARLDDLLGGAMPTLIKIDVEGHEAAVLAGAARTLASPGLLAVIMETNGLGHDDVLVATMARHGFAPFVYDAVTRTLAAGTTSTNTVFVRDPDAVQARCAAARRYRLPGGSI